MYIGQGTGNQSKLDSSSVMSSEKRPACNCSKSRFNS